MHATLPLMRQSGFPAITRRKLDTLQVNLGYKCNQSCLHCHVNAGPTRTEMMSFDTIADVLKLLAATRAGRLDLTGGAPELNPHFRELVVAARAMGATVMDRCNLTILDEPGQQDLAQFLATQKVEIVASLPCYLEDNVDRQRGKGVFDISITALKTLNALGYGVAGSGLELALVYNPQGPVLPPAQDKLESDYRRELGNRFGIRFNRLFVLTNMPIQRFASWLQAQGKLEAYQALLQNKHCGANLERVMCRSLISVDWQGWLYDCDFNQQLGWALEGPTHLRDLLEADPGVAPVRVGDHCFGCTAGAGSSCGGALS
jgi:radical SAM/Cys-rich protein